MASWRCGHRRTSPLAGTEFSDLASWPGFALAAALESGGLFPRELIVAELEQRRLRCPACRDQARRAQNHWAALGFAVGIAIVCLWRCAGG